MLILSLLLITVAQGARPSPPGKPKLTSCRSPEKETFTCWWEPGSDGGLPTTYTLFYRKENADTVYECSDYQTAGENSCFFNKNDTSIWVNYNITVVATNALGSSFSDPVDVDVVYIVQPHTPENVTVAVIEDADGDFLRVSWEPPHKADTRSGWITLIYELRVKLEGEEKWEAHRAGQQKMFNIFSLRSGGVYMVEVRCKPDHGFWSEWSPATYIKAPDNITREKSVWILIATFSAFIFIILTWILSVKRHSVKHCLLPPVPGPKIKGFDIQLLKNGKSEEEVFGTLVVLGFPPTSTDSEDLLVEYLEVYVSEAPEGKDLQDGYLKPKSSSCDSDSGRGSCDSHTLLMEKCGEGRARREDEESVRKGGQSLGQPQDGQAVEVRSPDPADGRVKTWPSVFSPLAQYGPPRPSEHSSLDMPRQLCLSDGLFPPRSSYSGGTGGLRLGVGKTPPPSLPDWYLHAHSDFDIPSMERQSAAGGPQVLPSRSMQYVEVQRVNQQNTLLLQPLSSHAHGPFQVQFSSAGEDYSQVKGVVSDNVLLLQRQDDQCARRGQEKERLAESFCTATSTRSPEKTVDHAAVRPAQEAAMFLGPSGYVDTAATLPTF